jgi:hypothetical protein
MTENNKQWSVRYSGVLDALVFTYALAFLCLLILTIKVVFETDENPVAIFLSLTLTLSPLILVILIVPLSMVVRKKMIKSLQLKNETAELSVTLFRKKQVLTFEIEDLAIHLI